MLTEREGQQLAAALEAADGIDRITIDVLPSGFLWRLSKGGREIFRTAEGPDQVPEMLQACEVLLNTELGIAGERLTQPAFN